MKKRIAETMRQVRLERGLTQNELSLLAGVPQTTISSIEVASRMPGALLLLKLCQALGISPNELFQQAGLLPQEGAEDEIGFWELWGIMRRLSVDERREVIRYALYRDREAR